ncbi:MAG: tRNA (adenosine(37)-N6)-threonylcarbamoyltransferase complex ATPase subunit type 1 TsaE [Oscillospiraceae bacterium]|jgi:tRNA threonylcarbamoyladenosine biosynthesis protein TsaE|nr:tRNA (adenosine(37)-N6)-threonylcarbamoyltransferase complex ATPase subunit type 1 TsaE [Oscillospiraceae bacterium]
MIFKSISAKNTINFAQSLSEKFKSGDIIAVKGEMGAGKTTFIRGLAMGMGLGDVVYSPTFALVNEYRNGEKLPLFHFDMYRITGDPETVGLDYYQEQEGVIVIEWFENIEDYLTPSHIITIKRIDDNTREIEY